MYDRYNVRLQGLEVNLGGRNVTRYTEPTELLLYRLDCRLRFHVPYAQIWRFKQALLNGETDFILFRNVIWLFIPRNFRVVETVPSGQVIEVRGVIYPASPYPIALYGSTVEIVEYREERINDTKAMMAVDFKLTPSESGMLEVVEVLSPVTLQNKSDAEPYNYFLYKREGDSYLLIARWNSVDKTYDIVNTVPEIGNLVLFPRRDSGITVKAINTSMTHRYSEYLNLWPTRAAVGFTIYNEVTLSIEIYYDPSYDPVLPLELPTDLG